MSKSKSKRVTKKSLGKKNTKKSHGSVIMQLARVIVKHAKTEETKGSIQLICNIISRDYDVIRNEPILQKMDNQMDDIIRKCRNAYKLREYSDFDVASISITIGMLYNNDGFMELMVYLLNQTGGKYDKNDVKVEIKHIIGDILVDLNYEHHVEELHTLKGGGILEHFFPILALCGCFFLVWRTQNLKTDLYRAVETSEFAQIILYGKSEYVSHLEKTCSHSPKTDPLYNAIRLTFGANDLFTKMYGKMNMVYQCSTMYSMQTYVEKQTLEYAFDHLDDAWLPYMCAVNPTLCKIDVDDEHPSKKSSKQIGNEIMLSKPAQNQLALLNREVFNTPETKTAMVVFEKNIINELKQITSIERLKGYTEALVRNPDSLFNKRMMEEEMQKQTNQVNIEEEATTFGMIYDFASSMVATKFVEKVYDFAIGTTGTPLADIQKDMTILLAAFSRYISNKQSDIKFESELIFAESKLMMFKLISYLAGLVTLYTVAGVWCKYSCSFYYRYFFSKKAVLAIENVPKTDIISISENMYTEPDNKKTTPPQKKTRKTRVKN